MKSAAGYPREARADPATEPVVPEVVGAASTSQLHVRRCVSRRVVERAVRTVPQRARPFYPGCRRHDRQQGSSLVYTNPVGGSVRSAPLQVIHAAAESKAGAGARARGRRTR